MSPRLKAEVTQLSIVSGAEQTDAGDVGLAASSPVIPLGPGKGNLYLLVHVSGEPVGKTQIHRALISILADEYSRVAGGVTNGIRQAIRAANDYLYQRNLEALPLWQRIGETCCAVLRGDDLYVGVAGEARVHVLGPNWSKVFPDVPTTRPGDGLGTERPYPTPLGVDESLPYIDVFHSKIEEGDLIVLASNGVSQITTEERIARAGRTGAAHLADTLSSLASRSDLSALLIQIRAAERTTTPESTRRPVKQRPVVAKSPRERTARRETARRGVPIKGLAAGLWALILALGARILTLFAALARGVQSFFSWLGSSGVLGRLGRGIKGGSVAALQGLGTLTKRMLPGSEPVPATPEVSYTPYVKGITERKKSSRWPLLLVLVVVAVVAAASVGVVMRTHSTNVQFTQLMDEAQVSFDSAQSTQDGSAKREELSHAAELVGQALLIRPEDAKASALQDQIFLAQDAVNEVVRLEFSAQIPFAAPLGEAPRLLLHEDRLFVLDPGAGELRAYQLDDTGGIQEAAGGALLLNRETGLGGVDIQTMIDLAWIEPGSGRETGNLLVLVNGSSLLQLNEPRDFTPVSIADTELWDDARLIDGYFGYLYVLDAGNDRILKYPPTGGTYDNLPLSYFQEENAADLSNASDMAIDGYIFILTGNSILKFSGGLREDFSVTGLEGQELRAAAAIFTSPDTQYLYVADAGDGRILQLTKEGAFVRQFLPPRQDGQTFSGLRDVSVDEAQGRLFALTTGGLFVAPVRQPPSAIQ
jgi:hypothetical protein